MSTKLSKKAIQGLLYMLCGRSYINFSVQLRSPDIQLTRTAGINDVDENPIEHWNGKDVYLWLNPMPMLGLMKPDAQGIAVGVPLDYIDCVGELRLIMHANGCYDMCHVYGERWQMAIYDAVYTLFDGKVDFDYPDICDLRGTVSHKTTPKEWRERELFDDMPRIEDFDFSHLGDFGRAIADRLVEESNKPVFKRMFGNSLKKTDTGLEFVPCSQNGGSDE